MPDAYDWITSADWFPSFQFFHDRVLAELTRQNGICIGEAQEVFKQVSWPYLPRTLTGSWQEHGNQASPTTAKRTRAQIRNLAKRLPGARRVWGALRSVMPVDKMSLPRLLNPFSPYHADFMPIYRALTTPPQEVAEH